MNTLTEVKPRSMDVLIDRLTGDHTAMLYDRFENPGNYDDWEKGFMCGLKDALELAKIYKERYDS